MRRPLVAIFSLAGAAVAPSLAAQPFPPEPPDQRRRVAGWAVEHAGEEDGGRVVRLTRERRGIRLEYNAVFWRGNYGIYMHSSAQRPGLACGSDHWQQEWGTSLPAGPVRTRLAFHLAECGTPREQIAAALQGFEEAYALAAQWVADAERLTAAEIEAIVNYGAGDPQ